MHRDGHTRRLTDKECKLADARLQLLKARQKGSGREREIPALERSVAHFEQAIPRPRA